MVNIVMTLYLVSIETYRYSAPRLNGHPALLASFLKYQKTNLHQIYLDKWPSRFNGPNIAAKWVAV